MIMMMIVMIEKEMYRMVGCPRLSHFVVIVVARRLFGTLHGFYSLTFYSKVLRVSRDRQHGKETVSGHRSRFLLHGTLHDFCRVTFFTKALLVSRGGER